MTYKTVPARYKILAGPGGLTALADPTCGACSGTGLIDPPEYGSGGITIRDASRPCYCIPQFTPVYPGASGEPVPYLMYGPGTIVGAGGLVYESATYPRNPATIWEPVDDAPPPKPKRVKPKRSYVYRIDVTLPADGQPRCTCDSGVASAAMGGASVAHEMFCAVKYGWPRTRLFLSWSAAARRAQLFRNAGATAEVVRSEPVSWPPGFDPPVDT